MRNESPGQRGDASLITRRHLLQALGAVGGSSLVMSAMDAWGLMGTSAGTRPVLEGRGTGTRVIVLGAGLSGLAVGYELGKLGYECQVLEARDRVGGLTWTVRRGSEHAEIGGEHQVCRFDEGQYFNAGAWRIRNGHEGVLGYCRDLGVPLEIFVDATDANYFYDENPARGALAGKKVRLREVKADLWGSIAELLAKAMDQGEIDAPLTADDKERLVDFLVSAGFLDSEDYIYRPPTSRGSQDRHDLSALLRSGFGIRVRSLYAGTGGPAPVFQPVDGMMEIAKAFQREMGERIVLGAEVQQIRQTADGVRVVYKETETGQELEKVADYCVSCLPMSVLQRIEIDLSSEMALAVNTSRHSDRSKMGLQMRHRFWEEEEKIFGGHLWAPGLQLGEFSYPSDGYFSRKGVLLGFYGDGAMAGLGDMPLQGRIEHVLRQSSKIHPQMRREFESAYCVWWDKVPYSLGAFARRPSSAQMAQFSKADGRIYMGSAATSLSPGWMEGAITSAWKTVETLHERVMRG